MAAQAGGGFKTLLSMGFAKPCSPRTAARRFKVDLEEIGRCMRAAEAAKATSKTLQEKPRRRPGCPRKSLTVSNVLGFGAASETDNVVATKGGNIVILDPESTSGERGDPIELDGENQDGQPRVEDLALEAEGGDGGQLADINGVREKDAEGRCHQNRLGDEGVSGRLGGVQRQNVAESGSRMSSQGARRAGRKPHQSGERNAGWRTAIECSGAACDVGGGYGSQSSTIVAEQWRTVGFVGEVGERMDSLKVGMVFSGGHNCCSKAPQGLGAPA
ncbi:unnamed protein product [Sphagnum tenellum]